MISILHEAPAQEPISVDALRDYLHAQEADEALLQSLISSARMTVEARSGLRLITQSWNLLLNDWEHSDGALSLPHYPVRSVVAIRIVGEGAAVIESSLYRLEAGARPALVFAQWRDLPRPRQSHYGIQIEIEAGFGAPDDVPEPLRLAVKTLAAHWYDMNDWNAHRPENAIPPQVRTLIEPHRLMRI
ncbi:MAG: hypothetical protein HAW65_00725 [Alphaproteobacteria bacterium]|nr:hypothetical protein [Alphaproteobacteria bacterium]MBE8219819.1 hypothetical protein [Alphaproteobacteria bacterium]